ncbi:peptidoglycan O-acetyltransferase [Pseudodesulfovibrio portus]|uniref:Peptidoglycan O-acetyltransferase n=1 Tax=Pseudodesulfovibrio portus TaxID=231439 RepID=A0ABM8ANI8_9BACT|nr:peptidoglycan O-acetyltransferase [Pseudodesulfovibrio portus]
MILGVGVNLAALGWFKYADFFVENVNALAGTVIPLPNVVLPLAISFFTFQQLAYLVDCHRGKAREPRFLDYSLFVCFFPQLIAGPIVHHSEMMGQFKQLKTKIFNWVNVSSGLNLFLLGLFKKVVIADRLSPWVAQGFDNPASLNLLASWASSLAYTFQIYFDFSGYTDMAMGTALMLNIKLPQNFNSPYKALSIQDFWSRWHMTLSRFLRDYLYIPLGGNRYGLSSTCRNLFITFLLGGIWHGAGWTFVIWGVLHGLAMVVHRFWTNAGLRMSKYLAWPVVFLFVNFAWVFFRAKTFADAMRMLKSMVGLNDIVLPKFMQSAFLADYGVAFSSPLYGFHQRDLVVPLLAACFLSCLWCSNSNEITERFTPTRLRLVGAVAVAVMSIIYVGSPSEFIYFQF